MDSQADLLKLIIQLLVSFASLLGVYVVFRLNSADSAIRNSWDTIDSYFAYHGEKVRYFAPREKFKKILSWVKGSAGPVLSRVEPIDEILRDIFKNIAQKKLIIRGFGGILLVCCVVSVNCLSQLWVFSACSYVGFMILIVVLFLFPGLALYGSSDWKYWAEQEEQWDKVCASAKAMVSPQNS